MPLPLPPHDGASYLACLRALHAVLRPRSYLVIGNPEGEATLVADCATICVDPAPRLPPEAMGSKPSCHVFRMTSDDFFAAHDPAALLGRPIDLAYLDGIHLSECLLRDVINTERACTPRSLILLHDCIPLDLQMAVRDREDSATRAGSVQPGWWTGDVWAAVHAIRQVRPDLFIRGFRAPPTGLVLIGNLSPGNTVLSDRYREIVADMHRQNSAEAYEAYLAWLQPEPTDALAPAIVALRSQVG